MHLDHLCYDEREPLKVLTRVISCSMCGIAGKIFLTSHTVSLADVTAMTDAIAHRGPDDSGAFISRDKRVGLGQRRLAIIDLSPLGHQPMPYRNRYQIVFNGEIYNHLESRQALLKEGYSFKSQSDTEVIMALYDRYGTDCLEHLRGMYAFAIYDEKEQVLFCARDRVGKKPFKYYFDGKVFMFASELKALLTQRECPREPDYTAIHHYLTLQYTPAPRTGFKGITKLPAAHYMLLDLKKKDLRIERYWKLDYGKKLHLTEEAWSERILAKLEESVRIRLMADVPLGAFLSGGVDSSAVVAMMANHSEKPVKTFSIGFNEESHNELPYARMIADRFSTDHTEFTVTPNAVEVLPNLVYHYEEPYADSSALPTYYVSKLTREHVTVALNGDGGDENFAGYSRYIAHRVASRLHPFAPLSAITAKPLTSLLSRSLHTGLWQRAARFTDSLPYPAGRRFASYTSYFTNEEKAALYSPKGAERAGSEDSYDQVARYFSQSGSNDLVDQALYADFSSYLPEDLLTKVDIATMAVALEGRAPFLDHEMLELSAQIPSSLKIHGVAGMKYILKKSLEPILPHEVMYRPKRGFSIPIAHWFRGPLGDYAEPILLDPRFIRQSGFRADTIERILREHRTSGINYGNHLWALLTLALWFDRFFRE